ncbi:MAG TPA: DUF6455 family protein [Burkholderiales bacterium]|jgi:hypothetical protein|nr:DUF6455 family protein [Burkholderiales bacterium]
METFIFLALFGLLVAAVLPALYALNRRMSARSGELEIWKVMHRAGVSPADAAAEQPRALAAALRRCALCPSVDACHEWLASSSRAGLERFCPNAAYFRKLEER